MVTQDEYNVTKQRNRDIYIKINLLNYHFQIVDELSGVATGYPSFTEDANSDLRRSCNFVITPTDASFDIQQGNKIWLDKYVQVYVGIKNIHTEEIVYTNKGIYLINNPDRAYDSQNNTLTLNGIDLMAKLTGLRNGELEGIPYIIPANTNVRMAMIGLLKLSGFDRYTIQECEIDVPNDIIIDNGGTVYDLLKTLRDILPYYQIYFDEDGVFCYNQIPFGKDEQVMVDDDIWNFCITGYNVVTDFEGVKNYIEVYGKTHNIQNYGEVSGIANNVISVPISSVTKLRGNLKVGFTTPASFTLTNSPSLNVSTLGAYPLKYATGANVPKEDIKPNVYYVAKMIFGEDYYTIEKITEESTNVATLNSSIHQYIVTVDGISPSPDDNKIPLNGSTFTFKTPPTGCDSAYNPTLKLNTFNDIVLYDTLYLENNTNYRVTFVRHSNDESMKYWYFMGEVSPSAIAYDDNPLSPFNINSEIGMIRKVLRGGEYDNIYTTELAQARADWELYCRCRLQDNITVTCIPIYWLQVNWLVNITLPNKVGQEKTEQYIIKNISTDGSYSGVQTIQMVKYYPMVLRCL